MGKTPYDPGGDPMVPSVTAILQRFTGEWATLPQPDAILAVCQEIWYTACRDRRLTPVTTVQLFLSREFRRLARARGMPWLSVLQYLTACGSLAVVSVGW